MKTDRECMILQRPNHCILSLMSKRKAPQLHISRVSVCKNKETQTRIQRYITFALMQIDKRLQWMLRICSNIDFLTVSTTEYVYDLHCYKLSCIIGRFVRAVLSQNTLKTLLNSLKHFFFCDPLLNRQP